jgi:thiol-disulfide isomerase/thioredoxin
MVMVMVPTRVIDRLRSVAAAAAAALLAFALAPAAAGGGAPPIHLRAVDGAGLRAALAAAPGRAQLIHVWASWCVPCVAEWPPLAARLAARAGRPIDVVIVALDDQEDAATAERVLARSLGPALRPRRSLPAGWQLLRATPADAGPVLQQFDAAWDGAIPTTLIFDAQKTTVSAQRGRTHLEELLSLIDRVAPARPREQEQAQQAAGTGLKETP